MCSAHVHFLTSWSFSRTNRPSISKLVDLVLTMFMVQLHHDMMYFPFYWVDFHWKKTMMFSISPLTHFIIEVIFHVAHPNFPLALHMRISCYIMYLLTTVQSLLMGHSKSNI